MKHRTLRCAAETLVLLLIAVMAVFLAAGGSAALAEPEHYITLR